MAEYTPALLRAAREQDARIMIGPASAAADRPDYRSVMWSAQVPHVKLCRDLYHGTHSMRAAGEEYLPKHPKEERGDYDRRLRRAVLFNAVRRTVQGYVGMVFRRSPVLKADVPDLIKEQAYNIDLQGNDLSIFARDVFEAAVLDGHCFIHVDAPIATDPRQVDGSLAEVRAQNRRPFWRLVEKTAVINARWEFVDGEQRLTMVVVSEMATEPAGEYGEQTVEQYRELYPGGWRIWRKDDDRLVLHDEGISTLPYIPLVPVYANRTGWMMSEPPLVDLAYENVEHWQVRSDHRHALGFASIPIPVFIGQQRKDIEWGANRAIFLPSENAKAQMLESSGASIGESRQELADIEQRMTALGLQHLVKTGRVQKTAEEDRNERVEQWSNLAAMARGLRDGLETALQVHADYLGLGEGGSCDVNDDFDAMAISPQMADVLLKMVASGQLTTETMWAILIAGEVLPETFDPETETERLAVQGMAQLEAVMAARGD
jgi:hypothetical protein